MSRLVPQPLLAFLASIALLAPAQAAHHQRSGPRIPHLVSNQGALKSEVAPRLNGLALSRQRASDSARSRHRLAAGWRRSLAPIARDEAAKRAWEWHNLEGASWTPAAASNYRFAHRNAFAQAAWSESITTLSHPAGCPASAFCGCGASVQVFGHPVRELWLAANWLRFPPASPAPGMAAVRAHHVVVIMEMRGGDRALVYDANSGRGETHMHEMLLAGYSIRNPHAGWRPGS
jgi:hypothetical protein